MMSEWRAAHLARYPDERNEDSFFLLGAGREVGVLFEGCGLGERRD